MFFLENLQADILKFENHFFVDAYESYTFELSRTFE